MPDVELKLSCIVTPLTPAYQATAASKVVKEEAEPFLSVSPSVYVQPSHPALYGKAT